MFRNAVPITIAVFLAALVGLEGCKKKKDAQRVTKPASAVVKLPDGVGVFSSQGGVWKIVKGAQAEQIVPGTCWFPTINSNASLIAYWEEHGSHFILTVMDLMTDEKWEVWRWNSPTAVARNLNLRNAPCWHPKEDTLFFADGKQIWQVKADGSDLQTLYEHRQGECYSVTADPEGTSFAFVGIADNAQNLWSFSYLSKESVPLTSYAKLQGLVGAPAWSPKGSRIAFVVYRADQADIWTVPTTGGNPTALTKDGRTNSPSWDITGEKMAVSSGNEDAYRWQIKLVNPIDGQPTQQLTRADTGAFSPSVTGAW